MTTPDFAVRDREEFERQTSNFAGYLEVQAGRLIDAGNPNAAGRMLVLRKRVLFDYLQIGEAWPAPVPPPDNDDVPAPRGKRPRAAGEHRHKFVGQPDGRTICAVAGCGKEKSNRGPKPADTPPVDTRTAPLPLQAGAADRFAGGSMGSSSTGERGR
jgi:hypothetical protein